MIIIKKKIFMIINIYNNNNKLENPLIYSKQLVKIIQKLNKEHK